MIRHLLVAAVAIELTLLAVAIGLAVLRDRERRRPGVLLDIVPPEGTTADLQTWSKFYRKLFGISYSPLKRRLYGQPSLVFELWSKDGDLGARCWAPARRAGMVATLLRAALPGVLLQKSAAQVDLEGCAARARLRLDIDPLHALDDPQREAFRSVVQALAEAQSGLIQLAVCPQLAAGWSHPSCPARTTDARRSSRPALAPSAAGGQRSSSRLSRRTAS